MMLENESRQWLEDVITPYGGQISSSLRVITFGEHLSIGCHFFIFNDRHFCLQPKVMWGSKRIPHYDWMLACFYTVLKDGGCIATHGKNAQRHLHYICKRCIITKEIRVYLERRREQTLKSERGGYWNPPSLGQWCFIPENS